jgi:hypothetical protein
MKKKFLSAFLVIAIITISTAYARKDACDGHSGYFIDAGTPFWDTVQTGGCDYVNDAGCLVHVETYTKYRLCINFGSSQTIETFC